MTYNIMLLLATLSNGLIAGVFFTWQNAVTPGIGRLSDVGYLKSFQSMNRIILNPTFKIIFLGTMIFSPLCALLQSYHQLNITFWLLIAACLIYTIGVIGLTFLGNIPLNNLLDQLDIDNTDLKRLSEFRETFESKWNKIHRIRSICTTTSFILLLVTCLY